MPRRLGKPLLAFLTLLTCAAFFSACDSPSADGATTTDGSVPPKEPLVQTVGPQGATLMHDGVTLVVPEGALLESTDIGIRRLRDEEIAQLPEADLGWPTTVVGRPVELTPHGLTFVQPAQLAVELPEYADVLMRLDDLQDSQWEPVDTISSNLAETSLTSFSVYGAMRAEQTDEDSGIPQGDPCDTVFCSAEEPLCSQTEVGCWHGANVALPGTELDFRYRHQTHGYSLDLSDPASSGFAAHTGVNDEGALIAFYPVVADLEQADVIVLPRVPFLAGNIDHGQFIVRGVYPVSGVQIDGAQGSSNGYVIVGNEHMIDTGTRPVLLYAQKGSSEWLVRELQIEFRTLHPFDQTWSEVEAFTTFSVREGGNLHVIVAMENPTYGNPPSLNRYIIPLTGWSTTENPDVLKVRSVENSDGFRLGSVAPDNLHLMALGPGAGGIGFFLHGTRVVDKSGHYIAAVQLIDVASGTLLGEHVAEAGTDPVSKLDFQDCYSYTAGTTGPAPANVDARHASVNEVTKRLTGFGATYGPGSQGEPQLVLAVSADGKTHMRCTPSANIGEGESIWMHSSRFDRLYTNVTSAGVVAGGLIVFSTPLSEASQPTSTVYGGSFSQFPTVVAMVPTETGFRTVALGGRSANGRSILTLETKPDGSLVSPEATR